MQLKPGRKYLRRDGGVVILVNNYRSNTYYSTHPLINPETGQTYMLSGAYEHGDTESILDIVAEYKNTIYTHLPKANK